MVDRRPHNGCEREPSCSFRRARHAVAISGHRHQIVLVRHGETEWSRTGQHTGRTDIPLTRHGREQAKRLAARLAAGSFDVVFTSPLSRAAETCRLAGFESRAETRDQLLEWDYGAYEGKRTADIRKTRAGWTLWSDGVPEGETATEVAARVDNLVAELRAADGDSLLFGHGHVLRVLAARWLGLSASAGRYFALDPATLSVLGYERETSVVLSWNQQPS